MKMFPHYSAQAEVLVDGDISFFVDISSKELIKRDAKCRSVILDVIQVEHNRCHWFRLQQL